MQIQSRSHPYTVDEFSDLATLLQDFRDKPGVLCLADKQVFAIYEKDFLPAKNKSPLNA
jgi:hypothetical protein